MEHTVKKVAMTGGSGPVGMALIRKLLKENIEILLFQRKDSEKSRRLPKDERLHIEYFELKDLMNYISREHDYDVFFHLGWTNTDAKLRDKIEAQYENVLYSCTAVEMAYQLGCHTFIGTGSQAEYGRHDEPLREDTLCVPETAYGAMKLCACHSTRIMCQKYGMRHIWARILSGYGMFDNPVSVLVTTIQNAYEGKPLLFSQGEQIWDFVYMDDIANAFYCMAKRGRNLAIYPVGSGQARPLKEYLEILCGKLGKLEEMQLGQIPYSEKQIMHLEADISTLEADTGWIPMTSFEEGIERMIEFYQRKLGGLDDEDL